MINIIILRNIRVSSDKYDMKQRREKQLSRQEDIVYIKNMRLILRILLFFILISAPAIMAVAEETGSNVPYFTNEDLDRYRYDSGGAIYRDEGSEENDSLETVSEGEAPESKQRHTVPYTAFEGDVRRIIIPVTLNDSVTVPMALDTGAVGMLISYKVAEKLGIFERDEGKMIWQARGIGGSTPAIITILDSVSVDGLREEFVPVTITESFSTAFEGLLGMDFMSNYSIYIDSKKQVLIFEKNPVRADMPGGHDEQWWRANFRRFSYMRRYWKNLLESIDREEINEDLRKRLKPIAEKQFREAEKLFYRLQNYASENAVPMSWREY